MSEEKKENRINIEDLPETEKELSKEEQKQVKGGIIGSDDQGVYTGIRVAAGDVNSDNLIVPGPHVKGK